MNIIVLSERFWPEGSGGELATYLYIKGLLEKTNYNITLLTGTSREKIPHDLLKYKRLSIINLELLRARHRITLWNNLRNNMRTLLNYIENTDVLYIPGASIIVAPKIKKHFKNIKIVYHLHGYLPLSYNSAVYYPYEKRKNRIYIDTCRYASKAGLKHLIACLLLHHFLTRTARESLKYVDKIICVSKRQEFIINDAIPWTFGKTTVIYNPPPPDVIKIEKKLSPTPLLLFVGGDNPVKGINKVIKVARFLKKQGIKYKLVITNRVNKKLVQSIKKQGMEENIKFTGRISRQEILDLYSRAWILLFPSIYEEPLPYTVIEAVLSKTVPIASKAGGIPEILRSNGKVLIFDPRNSKKLCFIVKHIISSFDTYLKYLEVIERRRRELLHLLSRSYHRFLQLLTP